MPLVSGRRRVPASLDQPPLPREQQRARSVSRADLLLRRHVHLAPRGDFPEMRGLEGRRPSGSGDAHPSPSGALASRERRARRAPLAALSASLVGCSERRVLPAEQGRRTRPAFLTMQGGSQRAVMDVQLANRRCAATCGSRSLSFTHGHQTRHVIKILALPYQSCHNDIAKSSRMN